MYESKKSQKAKEMRNFFTVLLIAIGLVALANILEFIFLLMPLLPVSMAIVLMFVLVLQVLSGLGVIEYDLSKLRK
jgi:uncharacterized membrane protein YoaK (UPF0700 family)